MKRRAALLFLVTLTFGFVALDAEADRWWAHVRFLADDGLEGRETGSAGYRKAAAYVTAEFQKAGLQAGGTDGYLQPIGFKSRRILEDQSSLALVRGGKAEPIALGAEATISMRVDPAPQLEAPIVFAGHGLRIPEANTTTSRASTSAARSSCSCPAVRPGFPDRCSPTTSPFAGAT